MKKCYIAAPIFNAQQLHVVNQITTMLKLMEFEYFSPYEASRDIWKGRAPKDCTPAERNEVVQGNIAGLHECDLLLCWVGGTEDGRTDTGVVWEMGYFNALSDWRKNATRQLTFTLAYINPADKRKAMNLMLAETVDAVAHGPAQLYKAVQKLQTAHTREEMVTVRLLYHPDKEVMHEEEAIS